MNLPPDATTMSVVIYASPEDDHLHSVHGTEAAAIECAQKQAQAMIAWRRQYWTRREPAAYIVVNVPIAYIAKVE